MSEEEVRLILPHRDRPPNRSDVRKYPSSFSSTRAFMVGLAMIGVLAGMVVISQSVSGPRQYPESSSSDLLEDSNPGFYGKESSQQIKSELSETSKTAGRSVDTASFRKSGKGRSSSRTKNTASKSRSSSKGSNSKVAHVENSDIDDGTDDGTTTRVVNTNDDESKNGIASWPSDDRASTNDDTSSTSSRGKSSSNNDDSDDTSTTTRGRSSRNNDDSADDSVTEDSNDDTSAATSRGKSSSNNDDSDDASTTTRGRSSRNNDDTVDDSITEVADDPSDDVSATTRGSSKSGRNSNDDDRSSTISNNIIDDDSMSDDSVLDSSSGTIAFKTTNEYITEESPVGAKYPWIENFMVAEPFREATFSVQNGTTSDLYTWEIHKITNDNRMRFEVNLTGYVVTHTFGDIGDFRVYLKQRHMKTDRLIAEYTNVVRSRFVRREIRSLSDPDRNTFFDAAEVLFNTSCDEGKAMYGDFFECIDVFTRLHNTLAGDPYCDHMHDGYGFLISHAALTLWFERVLQTVEPSVTVPYWDYTIEGEQVIQADDVSLWRQSQVWADDWFGPANNEHTNHIVGTGRWAYTSVKSGRGAMNFSAYTNAYGLMRAPWNQNMIPYVTRSNTSYGFQLTDLPGCKSHYDQLKYDSFADFGKWVQYNPHGTTHLAIGGVFNANWKNVLKESDFILKEVPIWVLVGFAKQKNMFRNHWLNCPVTCAPDTPQSQCKCVCQDIDSYMSDDAALLGVMDVVFAGEDYYFKNANGDNDQKTILKLLCNDYDDMNPVMGDSLEAASPQDISFWPTHPTVDRLFHHRRIAGMNDTDWPANEAWSVNGFAVDYCPMHNREDITPWPSFFESMKSPYSNDDLWNLMDPEKPVLPYIYDTFEWAHCFEAGYPMDLLPTEGFDVIEDDDKVVTLSEDHPEDQAPMPNLTPEAEDVDQPSAQSPGVGAMPVKRLQRKRS